MLEKNNGIVEDEIEAYRQFQRIVTELCSILKSESDRLYPLSEYIDKLLRIGDTQTIATKHQQRTKPSRLSRSVNSEAWNSIRSF